MSHNVYRIIFEDDSGQDVWAENTDHAVAIYQKHVADIKQIKKVFRLI